MSIQFLSNPDDLIDRLRLLADDLERLHRGVAPSLADLSSAPRLDRWDVIPRLDVCLSGEVVRHPRFGSHSCLVTSSLWAFDPDAGWARTLSRYYALGTRAPAEQGRDA